MAADNMTDDGFGEVEVEEGRHYLLSDVEG